VTRAEAVRNNVCQTYLDLGRCSPGSVLDVSPSRSVCRCAQFRHPIANFAARFDLTDEEVPAVASWARADQDFRIYVMTGDCPNDLRSRFEALGLAERYHLSGMVYRGPAADSTNLLSLASTTEEIGGTARFMVDTFFWRSPKSVRKPLVDVLIASASIGHEHYFWSDGLGPGVAATLTVYGDVAGLYNLCVRSDLRGRGLGASATMHIVAEAQQRGLDLVLQCDEGLVGWYRGLGFAVESQLFALSS
jgi:ribosomal protein S18 acetylase RimI-like enzyme